VLVAAVAAALVVWPPARSFAQHTPPAESSADKQEPAQKTESARRSLAELEDLLAGKQKDIQDAEQAAAKAQELLQRNAAELDRALKNASGHPHDFAQADELLRKADAALKELEQQAGASQQLVQQQERALQQADKQLQELDALFANGKLDEALRQRQMAQADMALRQARAAIGDRTLKEIEKQLQQAEREFDRAAKYWGQGNESLRAQAEPPETPRPQALAESGSAFQKWLNEDVAYIITLDERRVFLALRTDEERDQFIERFWARRDPTPDTAENEFKEEHYRRIAYANEHFASSVPGWRTDRGRIYIVYGPPDEIDDHRGASLPRQAWLYRHIEGLGVGVVVEFTDRGRTGDFRMTAAPASHGSSWQVMAGASDAAEFVAQSLHAKGFPVTTCPVRADRPSLTQVLVGPFPDEASLAKAKAALEAAGYHPVRTQ
jgi:GWxTD domain-containing protein